MYGTSGRIGLAILHTDMTIEGDMRRLLSEDTEVHVARVVYPAAVTAANLAIAESRIEDALRSLLPVRPSVLAWGCTSGSFYGGRGAHASLLERMQAVAEDIPVTTATDSLISALHALGVSRPSIGTPYSRDINDRLVAFLEPSEVMPVAVTQLYEDGIGDYELQDIDEDGVMAFIRQLDRPNCDSIVVSCTGLPTARVATVAEAAIGKPVVTSNLALLWNGWRLGRLTGRPAVHTRLLDTLDDQQIEVRL